MYAVIQTGGKQYRVQEGDTLRIEKLDAEVGKKVTFDQVLLVGEGDKIKVGTDAAKSTVTAVVTDADRGKKVIIFKKRRRKHYRLTQGHRQSYTAVQITKIGAAKAAKPAQDKGAARPKAAAPAKKASAKPAATKKAAAPKAKAAKPTEAKAAKPAAKTAAKPKAAAAKKTAAKKAADKE
ncbi:MAG: 50S ribosomal protein L21 [Mariprofundaceae bacterium]